MKFAFGSVVALIAGIWMRAHYAVQAQQCSTGYGQFQQLFSEQADANCTVATGAERAAPWLIGLGAVGVVVSLGMVIYLAVMLKDSKTTNTDTDS